MKKKYVVKLAGYVKNIIDPYAPKYSTRLEVFVPKPTEEVPLPCVLVSIRNGHQKLFFRAESLTALKAIFKIPKDARLRIESALITANIEADKIEQRNKAMFELRRLPPGIKLVRSDTGEVLEDVEKYLKESR